MDGFLMFALIMICVAPVIGAIGGAAYAYVKLRHDAHAYRALTATTAGPVYVPDPDPYRWL